MNYWLDLFTPYTWTRFQDHGAMVSGFRPRQRKAAFERVKRGDLMLCYLVKLSRWSGVLEIESEAYEDSSPIFADTDDPFTVRFRVRPRIMFDFVNAIPAQEPQLWNALSFTKDLVVGSVGWAQHAKLRSSLVQIDKKDGEIIVSVLEEQTRLKKTYELDPEDRRQITHRTVIQTERGEVPVEIPSRHEEEAASGVDRVSPPTDARLSIKIQGKIATIGAILGFSVWVPPGDRARVTEMMPQSYREKLVAKLPLNYDLATLKTIENIDVIWLDRRSIARAFEVEHTTAIYSGLLRMADLLAMQPRMNIWLHIVAPEERRDHVRREIIRPVFSVLEGGSMSERCSFLSYEAVDEVLQQPNLSHMKESIIDDYEEFFEA